MPPYAGLPEGAVILGGPPGKEVAYAGLPPGAVVISPSPSSRAELNTMPSIEGASPWEVGQMPTKDETYPYVRGAAQIAATLPGGIAASYPGAGAAATLAGVGVDAAYGKMQPAGEYYKEAALNIGIPAAGSAILKYGGDYIKNGLNQAAKRIYQSGAKFLPSLSPEARDKITTTALQNKILPQSQKSLDEVGASINAIDYATESAFNARNAVDGIPTAGIKDAYKRTMGYYRNNALFGPAIADELGAKLKYLDELPAYINPNKALEIRRNLNKDLRGFFDRANRAGATPSESSMTMALAEMRGELNQSLYTMFPELRQVGKQEASYIMLQQHLERTMNRLNNRDLFPLSAIIAGGAIGGVTVGMSGDWQTGSGAGLGSALLVSMLGSPNMKARVAFTLAKAGGLGRASQSTLELLNLTRSSATNLEAKMKALPFPRTMPSGKQDTSGIIKGGQEIVHAEPSGAYEKAWRQYANRNEGQFQTIPKQSLLQDRAPMPNEYGGPAPSPKMLADPGRFRNPGPEPYGGAVSSRATAIADSVRLGQMKPDAAVRELLKMAEDAKAQGNTYAEGLYRKMAKAATVPPGGGLLGRYNR